VVVITRAVRGNPAREIRDGVEIRRWIRPLDLGPGFGLTFLVTLSSALWRLRREIDIIHCHQALWEAVAAGLMAPWLGIPSVVQPACGGPYGEVNVLKRTKGRPLLRKAILRNSHFVAISEQIESELGQMGVKPPRIQRIGSGVDVGDFCPGNSPLENRLPPRPRVVFLGRLHPQKNLATLLRAWEVVRARCVGSLLLVGDGPERPGLEALARNLACQSSVHFLGDVDRPVDYLRAADLFVLPSIAEGMSNSLLEAMACALPVVVSRTRGNIGLVRHEQTGLLADAANAGDLAHVLMRLLEDRGLRKSCGQAARDLICREYSISSVVSRYLELYQRLKRRS
jgi:glycosyltransferase involved in cell wall biosynthesis